MSFLNNASQLPPSGLSALTGSFTGTGQSSYFIPLPGRMFNVEVRGTFVGTVQVERSFDGTNWVGLTASGTAIEQFTAPASEQLQEDESGVKYRLNCTAYTSGTITYRISQ